MTRSFLAFDAKVTLLGSSPSWAFTREMLQKMPYRTLAMSGAMSSRVSLAWAASLSPRVGGKQRWASLTASLATLCRHTRGRSCGGMTKTKGNSYVCAALRTPSSGYRAERPGCCSFKN
ncbi:hypothetical protein Tdes44962_MAKER03542 [Teratosphaeria destructans]|uniref:Uncharacterized protein n=1 Tax=Teratosphaeria destructans TaxID=418781 RepID=A0A9W7W0Y7_9PEZI|nr:hypothetical protein Tdes44962_MAKER03542 [Teratosphaeria destructans]